MGRKTWASIPEKFRPLRGRKNVVLSKSADVRAAEGIPEDVLVADSLESAVAALRTDESIDNTFVIGGASAFAEVFSSGSGAGSFVCDKIHLTKVFSAFECDVRIPAIDEAVYGLAAFEPRQSEGEGDAAVQYQFRTYANRRLHPELRRTLRPAPLLLPHGRHEEHQYLDAIRDVIMTGVPRDDRTGVGTISKFGLTMRFSLRDGMLPLLTTKRVFWRGVAEELLWFISGDTSNATLQAKGVHIWDGNASREFLDSRGLHHREVGDLGPVYGFQWRHFGAAYSDMHADYAGKGVDQLKAVIETIKKNPADRRIILSAWNPAALPDMALPPCHMFAQFFVEGGELSCQMYQRSGDMGLGIPFNIASYALLTRLIAQVTGLEAGEFIHVIGDAHVYKNHVEPLLLQLEREPKPFPRLRIDPTITDIDAFRFEHFAVEGYECHGPIKMQMAV